MVTTFRQWITLCETQALHEMSLPATALKQAARRLIREIDWGGGENDTVLYMLGYDPNRPPKTNSREFKSQLAEWALERVTNAEWNIQKHFNGDVIRVYRVITAPSDWKPDPARHPGLYWSWDEHAAEAHWGEFDGGHVEWLLIADLHVGQIDWVQTLAVNGAPNSEDESEITVKEGTPVTLAQYRQIK